MPPSEAVSPAVPPRLLSLDVMRGMTMLAMIVVNNPGSWSHVYPPLAHATWHGVTPTDLIFPAFMFMVGVSMPFSLDRRLEQGARWGLLWRVARRAVVLTAIGFFLGVFPNVMWEPATAISAGRWPGVLQRIAIAYLLASTMIIFLPSRVTKWASLSLLIIYLLPMWFYPVPEYGRGVWDVMGNFCWFLDNQLLAGHTWSGAPAAGFDPEGVWSTLPAIVTVLCGYFTGKAIRKIHSQGPYDQLQGSTTQGLGLTRLFVYANAALVLAYLLQPWIPINKQLWTPTFVFLTAGFSLHLLAALYYIIDIQELRWGLRPFVILGENAIFAYCLASIGADLFSMDYSGFVPKRWLFEHLFEPWFGSLPGSLLMALLFAGFCLAVTSLLHLKKIILRV